LEEGSIELMLHRRIFYDDGRGVDQALNEMDKDWQPLKVRTRHFITNEGREKARLI